MYVYNRHKRSVRYLSRWIKYQMTSGHGPRKPWTWVELRPMRTIWFDQPPVGGVQTGQLKRWRASGALALFSSLLQLSGAPELGALKRAQGWPGSRPARLSQPNQPSEGGLRLCQSRNGATKSRIVRRAFPVTSRDSEASHLKSPHENDRRSPSWTRDARNKELNSRGKTKQLQTCFKPIQASTKLNF